LPAEKNKYRKEETIMERTGRISTTYLVELSLLVAIIILMAFTPIGYIKVFTFEITLIVIPVAVGAITLGPKAGAILGGAFGITSFIQCFGLSAMGTILLSINPLGTFVTCVITRILVGWFTGLIYTALKKTKAKDASILISSLCCPLLNTLLYMSSLIVFFYNTEYIQNIAYGLGTTTPLTFVIIAVGINGLVEAAATFVVGGAISQGLNRALKRR
jgi:uncharacterized membrane protein